jgi:hypothetical protein
MLLVTLAVRTVFSICQNRMDQITLNKQLGNHLNKDILNASISLSSFPFSGCFKIACYVINKSVHF